MPHFKDAQNKVYFLDPADAEALHLSHFEAGPPEEEGGPPTEVPVYINGAARWLPADCVPISDAEAEAIRNPPKSLADLKEERNAYINLERAKANTGSFEHGGKVFSCDALSRGDIDGVNGYVAITGALPPTFPGAWKATDNSYLQIPDVAAWTTFYGAMVAAGTAHFIRSEQRKAALVAAQTPAAVAAIVW